MMVTWRIVQGLLTPVISVLGRGLCLWRMHVEERGDRTRFLAVLDPRQLLKLARKFRRFPSLFGSAGRVVIPRVFLRIARLQLVRLGAMAKGDVCLVIPRNQSQPVVIVKWAEHMTVPLETVVQEATSWYSKLKVRESCPSCLSCPPAYRSRQSSK